jgi:hypothetical protein
MSNEVLLPSILAGRINPRKAESQGNWRLEAEPVCQSHRDRQHA